MDSRDTSGQAGDGSVPHIEDHSSLLRPSNNPFSFEMDDLNRVFAPTSAERAHLQACQQPQPTCLEAGSSYKDELTVMGDEDIAIFFPAALDLEQIQQTTVHPVPRNEANTSTSTDVDRIFAARPHGSGAFVPSDIVTNNALVIYDPNSSIDVQNRSTVGVSRIQHRRTGSRDSANNEPSFNEPSGANNQMIRWTPRDTPPRNPRYLGHMTRGSHQDPTIPIEQSTSVWIQGIPPHARLSDILNAIKHTGRIFQTHLNPPTDGHATAAAKLVFTSIAGARRMLAQGQSEEGFCVLGQRLLVRANRNTYRENTNSDQCRVLIFRGPRRYINAQFLDEYFRRLFRYDTTAIRDFGIDASGTSTIQWEFGSILAQAASARLAITSEPELKDHIQVTYGVDPCE